MERRIRKPTTRAQPSAVGCADRADCDLRFALHHLPLSAGGGACADGCAIRADGWHLSALALELQLLGCCLGWIHRAIWHCGADSRGDGDLSRRSS